MTRIDFKVERQPQTVENLVLTVWSTDADELPDREQVTASVPASAVPITSNRVWVSFDVSAANVRNIRVAACDRTRFTGRKHGSRSSRGGDGRLAA